MHDGAFRKAPLRSRPLHSLPPTDYVGYRKPQHIAATVCAAPCWAVLNCAESVLVC